MTATNSFNRIILLLLAFIFLLQPLLYQPGAAAIQQQDTKEDTHELLQKSLSLVEIDKEIIRIQEQKELLAAELSDTELQLMQQEQLISQKHEQAGRVLRAYYMGDRNIMWAVLAAADSLPKLLQAIEYMELVTLSDKQALNDYANEYKLLADSKQQLENRSNELTVLEERLVLQRARIIELESQLETELAGRSDAERLRLLMKEVTDHWETKGLEEVNNYFRALSSAMNELPAWVQNNPDMFELSGFNYTIRVTEEQLNSFLQEQNDMFKQFAFTFEDDHITASGIRDDMEISVTGHYTLQETPRNGFIFHVDELLFNGFSLPDTTRKELEKQYDLGFYPELILSFVKAKSVELKDGELIMVLRLSL